MENKIDPAIRAGSDKVMKRKKRMFNGDLEKVMNHEVDNE